MMDETDFYVYLRSDENLNEYPNNSGCCFTNILKPTRKLNRDYQCCLKNIIYEPLFNVMKKNDENFYIFISVKNIESTTQEIFSGSGFFYSPSKDIIGRDFESTINALNKDLKQYLITTEIIDSSHKDILTVQNGRVLLTPHLYPSDGTLYSSYKIVWDFSRAMGEFLGLDWDSNMSETPRFSLETGSVEPKVLFIYCDRTHPVHLGHSFVNLLDIIPSKKVFAKTLISSIYKPVNADNLDSVSLSLVDERGKFIKFHPSVNVTVVLHFKPKY